MVCSDQTMVWREQTKSSVDSLFQIKYSSVDEAASLLLISPFSFFCDKNDEHNCQRKLLKSWRLFIFATKAVATSLYMV